MKMTNRFLGAALAVCLLFSGLYPSGLTGGTTSQAKQASSKVIDVTDFGADPSGKTDSTQAVKAALEEAKQSQEPVTVSFPKGEYHFWKDYATKKVYHTSNTSSLSFPEKYIGILVEGMDHVTLEGNDSSLIMHGDMMALAVVDSTDVTFQNFVLDYKDPDTVDISVVGNGVDGNGKQYTDFYVPANYNYTIQESGTGITWQGEISPVTGQPYWEKDSANFCAYLVIYKGYDQTVARASDKAASNPFTGVSSIQKAGENILRFTYDGNRPKDQEVGNIFLLSDSATRKTTGAFFWESQQLLVKDIGVHYLSGFGWLTQMCKDVEFYGVDFLPRYGTGKYTTSNADQLHVAGCGGYFKVTNCNFSMSHDDPINVHGSYMRVEQVLDDRTLMVKYIHGQQGGFRQFHPGDEVLFYSRTYLEPPAGEEESKPYVVESSIAPGETYQGEKLDMRTEIVTFQKPFSQETLNDLRIQVTRNDSTEKEGLYVAENVTYTPAVTISGNRMKSIPTRGILCTTRQPVIIEKNVFDNMAMANIYLSNDADYWYESGPIRNMIIRNNDFYIRSTGQAEWGNVSGIFVDPVVLRNIQDAPDSKGDIPVHRNITIEGNRFYMGNDNVVTANGVDGMTIRNNTIYREQANLQLTVGAASSLGVGQTVPVHVDVTETTLKKDIFKFTDCSKVTIEGNTYDDGLNLNVTTAGKMEDQDITIRDVSLTLNQAGGNLITSADHVQYITSDPSVAYVDEQGQLVAVQEGTVEVRAYVVWNGTLVQSNPVSVTVGKDAPSGITVTSDKTEITTENGTANLTATQGATLSLVDPMTGQPSHLATLSGTTYTALEEGLVMVRAEKDGTSASLLISNRFAKSYGNPDHLNTPTLSVDKADKAHLSGSKYSIAIQAQTGSDLYAGKTEVTNLVKFPIPADWKGDLRIQVDADGLPLHGDGYNNAGIVLYQDGNNYYSIGKKGHMAGVTAVYEKDANPQEHSGNTGDNQLTSTTFEIEIQNDTATLRYKDASGQWKVAHTQQGIHSITEGDLFLGLCAWKNSGGDFRTTFRNVRIAKASETTTQNMGNTAAEQIFSAFDNQAPTVSQVTLTAGQVNQAATVTATVTDSGDTATRTLYQWVLTEPDGSKTTTYTTDTTYTPTKAGTLQVTAIAVNAYGKPSQAVASESKPVTFQISEDPKLTTLYLNGNPVSGLGQPDAVFTLPEKDAQHLRVSYPAESSGVETVLKDSSGKVLATIAKGQNTAVIPVPDALTIQRGETTYTVKLEQKKVRNVELHSLKVDDTTLDLDKAQIRPGTDSYFLTVNKDDVTLSMTAQDAGATIAATRSFFQKTVENQSTTLGQFTAQVDLTAGINAFQFTLTGADGVSQRTIRLYLFRDGHNESNLAGLNLNATPVENFAPDRYEYTVYMKTAGKLTLEAVPGAAEQSISFTKDCNRTDGTRAEYEIHPGLNQIVVASRSENMWTTSYYTVNVIVTSPDNADLLALTADQTITPAYDPLKPDVLEYSMDTHKASVHLQAQALMDDANLRIFSATQEFRGTGHVEADLKMFEGSNPVTIQVTAPNNTTVKTYVLNINATGLEYASDRMDLATKQQVGYGSLGLDRSSSGGTIALMNQEGQRVEFKKGLGAHAQSEIAYNLEGQNYQRFEAYVGIDYYQVAQNAPSSVTFRVLVDGVEKFNSGEMTVKSPMQNISLDLQGAKTLQLIADMGDNNHNDHADWADAKFIRPLEAQSNIPVTGVVLTQSQAKLSVGDTLPLEASVQPGNATNQALTWSSDNQDVATVDKTGVVTAVSAGTANITVTTADGGFTATCTVTVSTPEIVHKAQLQKLYDYAKTLDISSLTPSDKEKFNAVMAKAQAVLEDASATQEQVDATWKELAEVIRALGLAQGDKTMLKQAMSQADEMMANQEAYVQTHWQQLVDAYKAAKAVMDNPNATQAQVDQAVNDLLHAINAQRYKANKSVLKDLITQVQGMDLSGYTKESADAFRAALAHAQAVLADDTLSQDHQSAVDAAVAQLRTAIQGLTAQGGATPSDAPQTTQQPETVPPTGDSSVWILIVSTLAAVVGAVGLLAYKRRRDAR